MKILVVIDGKPGSGSALRAASLLAERLRAELGVITVRSGTHATENPTPVGVDIPTRDREHLTEGLQLLLGAADQLAQTGLLAPLAAIKLRDLPHGGPPSIVKVNSIVPQAVTSSFSPNPVTPMSHPSPSDVQAGTTG